MTDEQRLDYIKSQVDAKQFISWKDAQFLLDMIEEKPLPVECGHSGSKLEMDGE